MRKLAAGIILLLLSGMITGCDRKETRDSYIEGTDFQYQYASPNTFINTIAQGKGCTYFIVGSYIYQMDEESEIMTPLCNKSNCLHDKERDKNRMADCNAFLTSDDAGISYMDGFLYFVGKEWVENDLCDVLYKISADGSTREKLYQWNGEIVESWCMHRNVLYCLEHTFDEDNQESYKIKSLELRGMGKAKMKTIYEPDENITVFAFGVLKAYGNHLYFNVHGANTKKTDKISDEDWERYTYHKALQYNISDGTVSEIRVPKQSDTETVSDITFWQDKLLFHAMDDVKSHQYDLKSDVYLAELDGTNATIFMEDMPSYRWYSSDGTYLYVSDCPEALDRIYHSSDYQYNINQGIKVKHDFTVNIDVYDKNKELVDRMKSPIKDFPTELPYGIGNRMYALQYNETGDGCNIVYWDKTKLGTYKGKEYTFKNLSEQKYSSYDLQMMEESNGEG